LAVKQYLAAQRQGTHKVKTRAEANGASKKLVKQKEVNKSTFARLIHIKLSKNDSFKEHN
jgi:hypothetical protein